MLTADHLTYEPAEGRWTLSVQLPRERRGITVAHDAPTPPSLADFAAQGIADGTLAEGDTLAFAPTRVPDDPDA